MDYIKEILSYSFAQRAIIAGVLVSLCAALLGINLVFRRFSMLGDGLSHVSFGAAAIALAAGVAPLGFSIPIVIVAAFLLLRLTKNGNMRGDAAVAILSSSALAIGIIVATMTTGMNTDISNYMFGSILAVSKGDVFIAIILAVFVLTFFVLFYNKLFSMAFDEEFSRSCGVKAELLGAVNAILTAVVVVVAMRMMGALLISAIITFPALSAMKISKKYKSVVIISAAVSVVSFLVGIFLSILYDMPASASIVVTNLLVFILFSAIKAIRKNKMT